MHVLLCGKLGGHEKSKYNENFEICSDREYALRVRGCKQMGREESKEQAKAAQKEKEQAACAKKQARKDKEWERGTDTRGAQKTEEQIAKDAEKARLKALAKTQETEEAGPSRPNTASKLKKKCIACKKRHDPKEACPE
ncbi:hypothetical protein CYMTET_35096 [Cymbomonas tetramitiformis]|uniref:Uncharacterized protein n=1 Tax=Cymbomonas tetramitiformis TaxID=36881 RepID=A0AAE0F9U0_9CHLO|nr:hypothetical protein CYMTET_35096 [Cymbomonas tetramitiformis]